MGRFAIGLACMTVLALSTAAGTAYAQVPPDVVRMRDGGFVRGTIVERVPGQVVVIDLPNGERRRIDLAATTYAGPTNREPSTTTPLPSVAVGDSPAAAGASRGSDASSAIAPNPIAPRRGSGSVPYSPAPPDDDTADAQRRTVMLRVVAARNQPLSLHSRTAVNYLITSSRSGINVSEEDIFRLECRAPCDIRVNVGTFTLGVSHGDGLAARVRGGPIRIDRDMTLEIDHINNVGYRIPGILLLAAGGPAGVIMTIFGLASIFARTGAPLVGLVVGGLGTTAASLAIGIPLALMQDQGDARVLRDR